MIFRLILSVVTTVLSVVFIMANTHDVELGIVFGGPVRIRLIFLLMSAFLLGVVVSWLLGMVWRVRFARRVYREMSRQAKPPAEPAEQQESE